MAAPNSNGSALDKRPGMSERCARVLFFKRKFSKQTHREGDDLMFAFFFFSLFLFSTPVKPENRTERVRTHALFNRGQKPAGEFYILNFVF